MGKCAHNFNKDKDTAIAFSINNNDEIYVVRFTKKYWDRCDANTLFKRLKILDVVNALRENPEKNVVINQSIDLAFEPKYEARH